MWFEKTGGCDGARRYSRICWDSQRAFSFADRFESSITILSTVSFLFFEHFLYIDEHWMESLGCNPNSCALLCFTYVFIRINIFIYIIMCFIVLYICIYTYFPQGVGPERIILCIARCVEVVGAQDGKQIEAVWVSQPVTFARRCGGMLNWFCIVVAGEVPTHVYDYCHFRLKWWRPNFFSWCFGVPKGSSSWITGGLQVQEGMVLINI